MKSFVQNCVEIKLQNNILKSNHMQCILFSFFVVLGKKLLFGKRWTGEPAGWHGGAQGLGWGHQAVLRYSPSLWDELLPIGDIFEALLKDDLYHIRCYKKTIIFNGHEDLNTLCKVPTVQSEWQ